MKCGSWLKLVAISTHGKFCFQHDQVNSGANFFISEEKFVKKPIVMAPLSPIFEID